MDIEQFYPSITKKLFYKAIEWASNYVHVSELDKTIIIHCRKVILKYNDEIWIKKNSDDGNNFDVPMGCLDGAEICELIGLYLLHALGQTIKNEHMGLYRDDFLAIIRGSGPDKERIKKKVVGIFKDNGLNIDNNTIVSTNVDYLDYTKKL